MSVETPAASPQPLRSKHTANFPGLLTQLGISLLVSTYQAGKLVILRAEGEHINARFRDFSRPMGLAADRTRLALGTAHGIEQFRNLPAVCRHLEPPGRQDACYLPRATHVTGDIDIHELAWLGDELWFMKSTQLPVCVHLTTFTVSFPAGGRRSSPPWLRRIAATSMAWAWLRVRTALCRSAMSLPWPRPTRHKDGGLTRKTAESSSKCRAARSWPAVSRCRTRPAGWASGCGCWNRARAASASSIWRPAATKPSPNYPGSRAAWIFMAISHLSGCRRCAKVLFSAAFPSPSTPWPNAIAASGSWTSATDSSIAFLRFEDAVQEVFAVQVLPGVRCPEVIADDAKLLADSFDLPSAALRQAPAELVSAASSK